MIILYTHLRVSQNPFFSFQPLLPACSLGILASFHQSKPPSPSPPGPRAAARRSVRPDAPVPPLGRPGRLLVRRPVPLRPWTHGFTHSHHRPHPRRFLDPAAPCSVVPGVPPGFSRGWGILFFFAQVFCDPESGDKTNAVNRIFPNQNVAKRCK